MKGSVDSSEDIEIAVEKVDFNEGSGGLATVYNLPNLNREGGPFPFKLENLKHSTIRYEVVYKNLLRDFRKFFIHDFNRKTEYISKKRRRKPEYYLHCLRDYISENGR